MPIINLSSKELQFLSILMEYASDLWASRICGDMPDEAYHIFTDQEKDRLNYLFEEWNSEGRDYEPGYFSPQGWPWLSYYAAMFAKSAEAEDE